MAEKEAKKRIGSVQTLNGKFGPFKKISLSLSDMGKVMEKDGKHYLSLDDVEGFNVWKSSEGETRYFLNLLLNSYETVSADSFKPSADYSSSSKKEQTVSDDLPF